MSDRSTQAAEPEDRLGMTDQEWERFQAYTHGFGEQDENGVDVSLLRENLRLTPSQRVEKLLRGLALYHNSIMTDLQPTFRLLFETLHLGHVRCVLIGGVAMRCHGSAHLTDDVDLCYARDAQNIAALAKVLGPLHPRLRGVAEELPFRWDARTLRSGMNFTVVTDVGDVDLLGEVPGVPSFEALWKNSKEIELLGVPVRVASLDDLIAMKRAAGRPKDQSHLSELEQLRVLHEENKTSKAGEE